MTTKTRSFNILLLSLLLITVIEPALFTLPDRPTIVASHPVLRGIRRQISLGTWSGTFFSRHANVAAFTMTVVVAPDSQGRVIGTSTLNSDCLKDVRLEVSVKGSQVTLAGSDDEGDNITLRGTVDATGKMLKASYILNGSASGRCETDGGTGNLAKY